MKSHDHNKKPAPGESTTEGIPETAPRVIVVEGDLVRASDLAGTVRRLGYGVVASVTDGAEALRISGVNPPDIAIVDLSLAGTVSGPVLAGQLATLHGIPVILTTTSGDENLLAAVKTTKPYGYLPRRGKHAKSGSPLLSLRPGTVRKLPVSHRKPSRKNTVSTWKQSLHGEMPTLEKSTPVSTASSPISN